MYFLARHSPVLRLPLLSMAWLLALATLGAVAAWKSNRTVRAVTVFTAIYAAAVIAFFVFARYRLYVAPGLAVLGAIGLVSSFRSVEAGRARAALPAVVAALAMGTFSASGIGTPQKREHLYSFISLAQLHAAKGEMAPAKKLLEEALGRNPSSAEALCAMGRLYLQERDPPRAAELLRRCVATDPLFPSGLYWLAVAEFRAGNRAAAERALVEQLRIVPGHEEAALWLGLIRGK
jgi:tetratricopeptide (TPR) repeat protein